MYTSSEVESGFQQLRSRIVSPALFGQSTQALGEYIGVAKFSARGAAALREHYHRARVAYAGKPWREAAVFEKAYKILLFQQMLENGVAMHQATTHGQYIEIDTEQDYAYANRVWNNG